MLKDTRIRKPLEKAVDPIEKGAVMNRYLMRGAIAAMTGVVTVVAGMPMCALASTTLEQQKKALVEKEQQIVQARVSTMMSQIRSHFVFNILNAISGMCKYDPEKADNTIVCFARYLRTNINIMEEDGPVPFRTAMQHLEDYVALEQVRFGDRIRFVKDIQVDQFMLPSLILQPLVENSIKYGIKPKPEGGTVTLRTWAEEKLIRISVEDDGIGFDVDKMPSSGSVGIKNVRFRLEQIMHGQLDIQSVPGKGTTVTISIPREEV